MRNIKEIITEKLHPLIRKAYLMGIEMVKWELIFLTIYLFFLKEYLVILYSRALDLYNIALLQIKKILWPRLRWLAVVAIGCIFSVYIFILTQRGWSESIGDSYKDLLGILAQTIGTIVAIFFSLILIPLNQVASKYSPKFLKYLKKDPLLILVFIYSSVSLLYDINLLLFGASYSMALAAIMNFGGILFVLAISLLHIIKLLNPYNSILIPAHIEIVEKFQKMIPKSKRACIKMTREMFKNNKHYNSRSSMDLCSLSIDKNITDYIQESLLPIREVAIKSIKELDLEQSKNSIQTMMSIIVNYLHVRKQYYSDDEPLLYFIYMEYKLLVHASSNNELKNRLHPFIVECWRRIGIQAAMVNVKGLQRIQNNLNNLVYYPIQGLKDLCVLNLLEDDSYAPGKACEALGDIGVNLMHEGYDHQAQLVVAELEKISILSEQNRVKHVAGIANYAIMKIYANGMAMRNIGSNDEFNYPYRGINKSVNNLLEAFLANPKTVYDNMVLSPLIGSLIDPLKGMNISRISEYGIFSADLNEFSMEMNLECVRANIQAIKRALDLLAIHKEHYYSDQAIENLYRIILHLLAYLNEPMAKDHILYYKKHPVINTELRNTAESIIRGGLDVLKEVVLKRADRYLFKKDHLDVLFSLYLIILYENKFRPNADLNSLFDGMHKLFQDILTQYKALLDSDCNDVVYKYFRLLVAILKSNDSTIRLASDFNVPEYEYRSRSRFSTIHESIYPKTMFDGQWVVKRPGFQVNAYYYKGIEQALKIDTLKFY